MAIKNMRMPDGEVVVFDEWLHWPIFSTIEWAAASGINLRAFSYVVGQQVPSVGIAARNATRTDTNQQSPSRMNHDEGFRLFSMTYEVFGLTDGSITGSPNNIQVAEFPAFSALNLRRLQRDLMIELFVGADQDKPVFRSPFEYIHQGPGPVAFSNGDSPNPAAAVPIAFSHGTGGQIGWHRQRKFNLPVPIGPDRVMYLRVWAPTGTVAGLTQSVRQRWYLDGVKRRPVA